MKTRTLASTALLTLSLLTTGCGATVGSPTETLRPGVAPAPVTVNAERGGPAADPPRRSERSRGGNLSPFEDDPGVTNLDPELLAAVRAAARDADADGVRFWITSGWRSREHQQQLLNQAVGRYGSLEEALRYVSTPDSSAHVTGEAVDIGPTDADSWLQQHGSRYGLCQSFANEIWHFELATEPGGTCPAPIPDSSYR